MQRHLLDHTRDNSSVIGCLHDSANVQHTSSKCIQNTRELLDVCWTFAGSCKHPITVMQLILSAFLSALHRLPWI